MPRRLAISLLSVAFLAAGIFAGPCTANAACAMARAQQMDCCKGPPLGISAPSCCPGTQEITGSSAPVTPERPVQSHLVAPLTQLASTAVVASAPNRFVAARIDPGAAPPGGTLIAQHTSLLL